MEGQSRRALSVALGLWLLSGCQPGENAVLIEATSDAYVQTMRVTVVELDERRRRVTQTFTVNRDTPEIEESPIRVAVQLEGPRSILVHLSAQSLTGAAQVATRCYDVAGVLLDDVRLVFPPAGTDPDGDGFAADPLATCFTSSGAACVTHVCPAAIGGDCSPDDATVSPGETDLCEDGIDQDCSHPPGDPSGDSMCRDNDGDGYRTCSASSAAGTCDCDDADPDVSPAAEETDDPADGTCSDGFDQNCDGAFVECDRDRDGYPADQETNGTPDCDDTNMAINPSAPETCTAEGGTPVDENCNGLLDESADCIAPDLDRDGVEACGVMGGPPAGSCDCNDCDSGVNPGVVERCGDAIDQDCDGTDVPCPAGDADGDGDPNVGAGGGDCNDAEPTVNSQAPERCADGIDQDCDATTDDGCETDSDMDGWVETGARAECEGDPTRNPGAPDICNGIDDDCDGTADEVLMAPIASTPPFPHGATGCIRPDAVCTTPACTVDYATAFRHCSACRLGCEPEQALMCVGGTCDCIASDGVTAPCPPETRCCEEPIGCVPRDSPRYCGSCDNDCNRDRGPTQPAADACIANACTCGATPACGPGQMCCGAVCMPILNNDTNNCGECGNVCNLPQATASCDAGVCRVAGCSSGWDNCDGIDSNGCETPLNTLSNCGGCGAGCSRTNASATCGTFSCRIESCNSGFGNCNGSDGDGCELRLNRTSDCGGCGVVCDPAFATGTCPSGACEIASCDTLRGDCSGGAGNGCETDFATVSSCNGCGVVCSRSNATPTCPGGSCQIQSCDGGWDDCDGSDPNGCERSLNLPTSCGSCTNVCALANTATHACPSGSCRVMTCNGGWGNCDTTHPNGCEQTLTTLTHCGACATPCARANATATCGTGACAIQSCNATYDNCDGVDSNGCEQLLRTTAHCGACSIPCAPANATGNCTTGTCAIGMCNMGFADCGGGVGDGCETMLGTDSHCSGCGMNCPGAANMCCSGACVDTNTSNMHCGGCSRPCGGATPTCMGGMCV